jgi:hypothetical protein
MGEDERFEEERFEEESGKIDQKNQFIVSKSIKKSQKNTAFHKISE